MDLNSWLCVMISEHVKSCPCLTILVYLKSCPRLTIYVYLNHATVWRFHRDTCLVKASIKNWRRALVSMSFGIARCYKSILHMKQLSCFTTYFIARIWYQQYMFLHHKLSIHHTYIYIYIYWPVFSLAWSNHFMHADFIFTLA